MNSIPLSTKDISNLELSFGQSHFGDDFKQDDVLSFKRKTLEESLSNNPFNYVNFLADQLNESFDELRFSCDKLLKHNNLKKLMEEIKEHSDSKFHPSISVLFNKELSNPDVREMFEELNLLNASKAIKPDIDSFKKNYEDVVSNFKALNSSFETSISHFKNNETLKNIKAQKEEFDKDLSEKVIKLLENSPVINESSSSKLYDNDFKSKVEISKVGIKSQPQPENSNSQRIEI